MRVSFAEVVLGVAVVGTIAAVRDRTREDVKRERAQLAEDLAELPTELRDEIAEAIWTGQRRHVGHLRQLASVLASKGWERAATRTRDTIARLEQS